MGNAVGAPGRNWAGNYAYRASRLHRPTSTAQLCDIVARGTALHALGSRHSFNDVADTGGELISLEDLPAEFELAADRRTVTVGGGARYGAVAQYLAREGLALRNFASLPHISVAGAISTGTHGSGERNRGLASDVRGLDIVLASGQVRHCSPQTLGDEFAGVVVSLGALGVITRVTLDVVPAFDVRQDVYEALAWPAFDEHAAELTGLAYSVSMFTDFGADAIRQLWLKSRADADGPPPAEVFGARRAASPRHPVPGMDPANATEQLGVAGLAHDRLPHFRIGFTPSNGAELQSEYLVDRRHLVPATQAVRRLADRLAPLLQVAEIRTIAADELWLSPSRGRDTAGLHFTWVPRQPEVEAVLVDLELALAPFDARPHWGKLFVADADRLHEAYPLLPRFGELARRWDPEGKFRNAFLARLAGPTA